MAKLSATKQWMIDHPNDDPCPKSLAAAKAWRRKRGLDAASIAALRAKYAAAMAEKRARQAKQEPGHASQDPGGTQSVE